MPILVEPRAGLLVAVETSTGRIVDHIEVREGVMNYVASDGEVLESKNNRKSAPVRLHCMRRALRG